MPAERKEQGGAQKQPRNHPQESPGRRVNKENRPREPAGQTGDPERNQNAPRNIQLLGIGAAARRGSYPQRERVGRIGRNHGKSNKAPAPGHGIHAASEGAGKKQKDRTLWVQAEVVS